MPPMYAHRFYLLLLSLAVAAAGCGPEVVVYSALDREFSEPIFEQFTRQTGIQVRAKYDTESTKTVGLTNAILAERNRPRCDVFWNNEILHTLRLEKEGLLDAYLSPAAADYPPEYRSAKGAWHGFAARARVLIVNTRLVKDEDRPSSIHDLADPAWKGKAGIAKPLFGTTATHAACLFAHWGDSRAKQFFRRLKKNVKIMSGNKQVALAVASGQLAFGLTDTDDAIIEIEQGRPVMIVYPDQGDHGIGTLFIPNTVARIQGSQNTGHSRRLIDYLLSPEVESRLAQGRSAQIPLGRRVNVQHRIKTPRDVKAMRIDFAAAAAKWQVAAKFLREEFMR